MGASHCYQILKSVSWGSTQANDATMRYADIALPGKDAAAHNLINNNKADSRSGHKREGEKLAEHAVVGPRRHLCEMAVAAVLHAVGTFGGRYSHLLVSVQRRDDEHRHKQRQQHPCSEMSLQCQFHGCKVMKKGCNKRTIIED